ncbi:hypothetical protein P7K49_018975 [Saguinus oedipus]|uniref:Uncharacterized protein n=1 Tax=Saguinus oedipus TaxID=9490 RepID=A0ABQ9UW09_SAGOE|nr:hypothetical protein P7K49_018975 [Saguinus oedipus]
MVPLGLCFLRHAENGCHNRWQTLSRGPWRADVLNTNANRAPGMEPHQQHLNSFPLLPPANHYPSSNQPASENVKKKGGQVPPSVSLSFVPDSVSGRIALKILHPPPGIYQEFGKWFPTNQIEFGEQNSAAGAVLNQFLLTVDGSAITTVTNPVSTPHLLH